MNRLPKHRGAYERPIRFEPAPWPWHENGQAIREWTRQNDTDSKTSAEGPGRDEHNGISDI